MNFKELDLKKSYTSDEDDLINSFYIPVLSKALKYNRIAGYFSSTSLAIAARGILGLIENGGTMNLIVSPQLSKEDVEIMKDATTDPHKYISDKMINEILQIEDELVKDHVYALGWMIANKKLNIKVAVIYDGEGNQVESEEVSRRGIFHQKVGFFEDIEGNVISFSGSINETCSGWLDNIEEFKVFRGWEEIENMYCESDINKFTSYWNNENLKVRTVDIPEAVINKFIEISPRDIYELKSLKKYKETIKYKNRIDLFEYQKKAIKNWIDNNHHGIFEMATGTGKTFTALGCLDKITKKFDKLITIIACPQNTLMLQWKNELDTFGVESDVCIIADSTNRHWKDQLADVLMDISLGCVSNAVVITTHITLSSNEFMEIIKSNKRDIKMMLIADEVHGLGSEKTKKCLINEYDMKLGLSATPNRWYDEKGTKKLHEYFRGVVYEFTIMDALSNINPLTGKTYLVKYIYEPKFISLTESELEDYNEYTKKIISVLNKSKKESEYEEILETLLFQRSNIQKSALEKYYALEEILNTINNPIRNLLIFVSPQQIDQVMKLLKVKQIIAHRFTQNEGTKPDSKFNGISEREFIIEKFKSGKYQVLVSIKCMDEGLDIPSADAAILMASSTNPREYIQRIGRVIRQAPGKSKATIYDMIVRPNIVNINPQLLKIERSIFNKELVRAEDIARNASNNAKSLKILHDNRI